MQKDTGISRRAVMLGTSLLPALGTARAQKAENIVISSANGTRACARAMEILKTGGDTLDAVVAGVNINEEDPEDNSVGYGGLPNEEGVVELDASVMHGPSRRAGSVASIRGCKTPSKIAKLVMEQTDHIMLVGAGASKFAVEMGYPEENLLTEKSRIAWLTWKTAVRDPAGHSNWGPGVDAPKPKTVSRLRDMFPRADEETLQWAWEMAVHPTFGTINCLSRNAKGEMSGVTTTSGLAWKIAGRVGDSPIIGAGLYVDQDVGGAGSTGRGEENIRIAGAHTIIENMRHGMTPREAALDALKRVARNFDNDMTRLEKIDLNFYALRKDGEFAGASLWSGDVRAGKLHPARFAVNDGSGESRLENTAFLFERKTN
ncbi:MAG TPA: N(4)-(beta-N-acetylglucosaminyl)-L-asparaginase [Bryobacteraceae bacterium]|nr:N(4)-(beta-N-acetylglucosaminyl)-L-asparaginase [Bryobacteraceae bacterium]